jgi:hypothetical protein
MYHCSQCGQSGWFSVQTMMPTPYKPVMVKGGCAYWDGTNWYTYMERNHPKIVWDVNYWAPLPENPYD